MTDENITGMEEAVNSHHPASSTDCIANWILAKRWIQNCRDNHVRCNQVRDMSWVPSRLVDLGPAGQDLEPRLRIFANHQGSVEYTALSHCWGGANIHKLQKINLALLSTRIPVDHLPNTFRHAMSITRRFGFRYLWIDSLCIIQDSEDDWRQEAAVVGMVYMNSVLTIAATSAADSTVGCFFTRNPHLVRPSRVQLDWVVEFHPPKIERKSYYLVNAGPTWEDSVDEARLNRRGWVVQERVLSPRILHFHHLQLHFECRELETCESFPTGLTRQVYYFSRPNAKVKKALPERSSELLHPSSEFEKRSAANQHWAWIVETYSQGGLSVLGDKLIALSGIANEMQKLVQNEYLAGLWRRTLLDELAWCVRYGKDDDIPRPCRPHTYRAPSWSWASVEGGISYENCFVARQSNDRKAHVASIVDARVNTVDGNSTGQATGGFVQIRGHVARCTWTDRKGSLYPAIAADISEIPTETSGTRDDVPAKRGTLSPLWGAILFDDPEDAARNRESLYFLPLFVLEEDVRNKVHPHGLILQRIAEGGEYARLGTFHSSGEEEATRCCSWPEQVITVV
jgi:hypothetical protein